MSDKQHDDTMAKTMIANVNIGMLEKGTNKSQKSIDVEARTL